MWTRAATEARARPLVEAYNGSHKNQVELTVVPTDDYQAKVGAAAGSSGLPDLFSADVVFMPNWTSQGLFQDITSKIDGLPYADKIAQAHIVASTWENKKYGLPFIVDLSVWFYNKALYAAGRARPGEAADHARRVRHSGARRRQARRRHPAARSSAATAAAARSSPGGRSSWADGEQVMNAEGTQSMLNSDTNKKIYSTFRSLVDDGTVWMPDSKTETGPTWTGYFLTGKVGIMPCPPRPDRRRRRATSKLEPTSARRRSPASKSGTVDVRRRRQHRHRA